MIKLETSAKNFVDNAKEVINDCIKQATDVNTIRFMTPESLTLMHKSLTLLDESMEYIMQQAQAIDAINRKLDRLLETKS